jgi:hypothetical protein
MDLYTQKHQLEGEIVDIDKEDVKGRYEVGEKINLSVGIKNTGAVNGIFWVQYMLYSPGETPTTYFGPYEYVYVNSSETDWKQLSWTVPDKACAGTYSLFLYLYDGDPAYPNSKTLDTESIPYAVMIDRDISFIQIETLSTLTGEQRAIHVHIADHDVVKSGTLTFKVLISAFQLAKLFAGTDGTLAMLGRGLNAIKTI